MTDLDVTVRTPEEPKVPEPDVKVEVDVEPAEKPKEDEEE